MSIQPDHITLKNLNISSNCYFSAGFKTLKFQNFKLPLCTSQGLVQNSVARCFCGFKLVSFLLKADKQPRYLSKMLTLAKYNSHKKLKILSVRTKSREK